MEYTFMILKCGAMLGNNLVFEKEDLKKVVNNYKAKKFEFGPELCTMKGSEKDEATAIGVLDRLEIKNEDELWGVVSTYDDLPKDKLDLLNAGVNFDATGNIYKTSDGTVIWAEVDGTTYSKKEENED